MHRMIYDASDDRYQLYDASDDRYQLSDDELSDDVMTYGTVVTSKEIQIGHLHLRLYLMRTHASQT